MGLFSNKKKVEVNVEVSRAIEDRLIPDTTIASTTKAILSGGSIPEYLADGWMQSIGLKADRMYRYAQKWHPYGMPVSTLHSTLDTQAIVQKVLEAELRKPVKSVYFHLAPFNVVHHAWEVLTKQYGYDSTTNQIAVLSQQQKVPVYLKDIVGIYSLDGLDETPAGAQETWGLPANAYAYPGRPNTPLSLAKPTPFEADPKATKNLVRIIYVFEVYLTQTVGNMTVAVPEWREGVLDLDLSAYALDSEWYQLSYQDPQTNKLGYWSYQLGSNRYPELEAAQDAVFTNLGTYFPFTYFRYDFVAETTARQEGSDPYEDQKKMMSYLSLDYDMVGDGINANPGIENIVHAFAMFGVAPGSEDPVDQKYLYEYFNALWYATGAKNPTFDPLVPGLSSQRFSISDKRFAMSFGYKAVTKTTQGGKVTKLGGYTGSYANGVYTYRFQRTLATYDELQVSGLLLNYRVYKGYGFTGKAGSKALLIPLDRALFNHFNAKEREVLIARSLHYVMCSYIEYEVKWYSSGWFKIVIVVVALVIAFFTGGAGSGLLAAISAATTLTAAAIVIAVWVVQQIVISMLVTFVFSLVAKAIGGELAMIIGIAVMLYGAYVGMSGSTGPMSLTGTDLVATGNNLVNAGTTQIQTEIKQIQGEMTEFNLMAEQKWAELEEVKNLLGKENLIDPFEFIGKEPRIVFGESPDDFYSRTVHSGNIGTLGIDAISSFTDISLTLPKLPQSFGDLNNELA